MADRRILIDTSVVIDHLRMKNKEKSLFPPVAKYPLSLFFSFSPSTAFLPPDLKAYKRSIFITIFNIYVVTLVLVFYDYDDYSSNVEELRPDLTILAKKDLLSKFLYSSSVNGSASIKLL